MPHVVCCFKWVVDESYLKVGAGKELETDRADCKISDYDRNAIEEAVRLKETYGGTVTALTVGPSGASKGVKDALSRGADNAYFLNTGSLSDLKPEDTAALLAQVIASHLSECDLIICGEGSSDLYACQVGPRLAEHLGMPLVSFASRVEIKGNTLVVERKAEDGMELVETQMPAVITVTPDINTPRIPSLRDTLGAAKKPVVSLGLQDVSFSCQAKTRIIATLASELRRQGKRFEPDEEGIKKLLSELRQKGVLN